MKVLTSVGVALALSFGFYDQKDVSSESYVGGGQEEAAFYQIGGKPQTGVMAGGLGGKSRFGTSPGSYGV